MNLYLYGEIYSGDRWEAILVDDSYHHDLAEEMPLEPEPFYQGANSVLSGLFCGTEKGIAPIVSPRGLPEDLTPELRSISPRPALHTNWLFLEEIQNHSWGHTSLQKGVVTLEEFERCRQEDRPPQRFGQLVTPGPKVEIFTEGEYLKRKEQGFDIEVIYYVEMTWAATLKNQTPLFWQEVMPRLEELSEEGGRDLRVIGWLTNE